MVQTTVYKKQALGMPGEFYDDSPRRVSPYIVSGVTDGAAAAIGLVFTEVSGKNQTAVLGGTGKFAGIAVNPKNYPVLGGLVPSLTLADGTPAQLCRMGLVFVMSATAVTPGQTALYNTSTGAIQSTSETDPTKFPAGTAAIPNSEFKFFSAAVGEVAVLQITD